MVPPWPAINFPTFPFESTAACPNDKRPIAGGGTTTVANTFITRSYPSAAGWSVRWETESGSMINPLQIAVYALCAPRL
jgi:hypothetical protein